jgi:hypothetical protein
MLSIHQKIRFQEKQTKKYCSSGGLMSASYWKMVGENIAKGLGEKNIRSLGTVGKVLGRTGAVVSIGFLVYELYKKL